MWLASYIIDPSQWEVLRNNFGTMGPMNLFGIFDPLEVTNEDIAKAHKIVDFYVGSVDNINEDHLEGMLHMYTDAVMQYGAYKTTNHLVKHDVTTYHYLLNYQGQYSFTQIFG